MNNEPRKTFFLDGKEIPFREGQTVFDAAMTAGEYIPHLCHNRDYEPHSSCRICTVIINGRPFAACTQPAVPDQMIQNNTPELREMRRTVIQMLFVEGNHHCPSCEKSGNCKLQATAYELGMQDHHFPQFSPARDRDASHRDVVFDRNRCILCGLCLRVSRDIDQKNIFAMTNRGIKTILIVDSPTGLLGDSNISVDDRAVQVCPVGALMPKRSGYAVPIGQRSYDREPISSVSVHTFQKEDASHA